MIVRNRPMDAKTTLVHTEEFWKKNSYNFGELQFRQITGEVWFQKKLIAYLPESESETLGLLMSVFPLPMPRKVLVKEMRKIGVYWHIDTVKVVVSRIRHKLGRDLITTHPRGYLFNAAACYPNNDTEYHDQISYMSNMGPHMLRKCESVLPKAVPSRSKGSAPTDPLSVGGV